MPTTSIAADSLIKALPCQKHEAFIKQLNLVDIEKRIKSEWQRGALGEYSTQHYAKTYNTALIYKQA